MGPAVLALLLAAFSPRSPGDPPTVPFTRAHGLVFVELALVGEPLVALLDTGANASAIDPRRSAGLPALEAGEVEGTTGTLAVEMVALHGLELGGAALPELRATRRDLSGLLAPEGRSVEMILGSDAFVGRALTLDFAREQLELADGRPGTDGVAMVLDLGIPTLPAVLGGVATTLRIDSGASLFDSADVYVNVPMRLWEELRSRDPDLEPHTRFRGTGADGAAVELPVARIEGAVVGPRELASVFVIVQPAQGYFARSDAKGFVGNNFLEKLGRVTLDYAAGRLRVADPGELGRGR